MLTNLRVELAAAGGVLRAEGFAEAKDGHEGTNGRPEDVCTDGGGGKGAVSFRDGGDEGDEMKAAKRCGGDTDDDEEDFHAAPFDLTIEADDAIDKLSIFRMKGKQEPQCRMCINLPWA